MKLDATRRWVERDPPEDRIAELEQELALSQLSARLLVLRGVDGVEAAERFLAKRLKDLEAPEAMRDMAQAAERFASAINNRQRILVHGDYDVDGSTGTTLLKLFCQACNHDAIAWIPDRRIEGYGLSEASLRAVEAEQAQLMITVDCGIADHGWAQRIEAQCGCDVIITDHHLPQGELPRCHAVCNPNRPDCDYPDKGLAGVGVAWKLCWATAKVLSGSDKVPSHLRQFLLDALALVAVGTVADCAPLLGENRILVHHGLQRLQATTNPGLRALLQHTRLDDAPILAKDIGWKIGPLLNASGRLGSAMRNITLLTARDNETAASALDEIVTENEERKRLSQSLTEELIAEIEGCQDYQRRSSLVFAGEGWHQGVVGIVASRLVERFHKPAAVIAVDSEGLGKGSLRTTANVHLGHAIEACREHLLAGGGHAMAAGITIAGDRVDAFSQAFDAFVAAKHPGGVPVSGLYVDAGACVAELDEHFFADVERLEPFGNENPQPLLCIKRAQFVTKPELFGRSGDHMRGGLTDPGGGVCQLLAWRARDRYSAFSVPGARFDVLAHPEINYWRGRRQYRLRFVDGSSA